MTLTTRLLATCCCLLLTIGAPFAVAQTTNASITGIITDSSGGAIPGVTVTVTNKATAVSRSLTTNEAGAYTAAPLIPGTYEVRAASAGFKTKLQPDVVLQTGAVLKIDFTLDVGAVSESVEVTGAAPILQTQEASVAGVVTTSQLERIPVNGRNFTRLIVMMPGVSDIAPNQSKGGQAGLAMASVNGQRQQDSNYTIDGVDNNMMYMSSGIGAPPMDAIQEFRVATNNSAEFGRSAGANVNLSIKSGTRDLHGSVYEYLRNDKFDANDWFANAQGRGKVPFRQNQYGVAVGGPVMVPKVFNGRDSTFWFASWEGYRRRRGNTTISSTPNADWKSGDFSNIAGTTKIYDPLTGTVNSAGTIIRQPFAGNIIPKARIHPGMSFLVDTYMPASNRAGVTSNFLMTDPTANDRDILVLRGDHAIGTKDMFFARFMRQRVGENAPSAYPVRFNGTRIDTDNFGVGWNHVFSPTTVLEAKYGYNHPNNPGCDQFRNGLKRADVLSKAGVKMFFPDALCDVMPNFSADGLYSVGGGGGETIIDTDHQYEVKLSKMLGRHSMRTGFQYMRRAMDAFFANPSNGSVNFWTTLTGSGDDKNSGNSFATMLLGYPSYVSRGQGIPNAQGRQNSYSAFFQDDWRFTDKITVNLGVRWEGFNRPYDANDALGNLLVTRENGQDVARLMWAGVNPLPAPDTGKVNEPARTYGYGRSLMKNRWLNFAPRVGIAYQVTPKTVVRLGFGMYYNSTFMQELNDLRKFWPYLPQQWFSPNTGAVPDMTIADPGPSFTSTQAIGGWPQDPNNRTPYSQQWNVFIQRELMNDVTLDVGYVGSANRHQIGYVGWNNAPTPGPAGVPVDPRRRLASSGFTGNMDGGSNVFSSEYNAMELKITKRFSKGLSILGNYTWGRVMDDQSSLSETKYQDIFNRRADWSPASYDIKHAFKAGYVYDIPVGRGRSYLAGMNRVADYLIGGWAIEGLLQIQTGRPLNVLTGVDTAHTGSYRGRPDVVKNPILPMAQRSIYRWFDTSAFVMPVNAYGNSGANVIRSDGKVVADVSVAKKFKIFEKSALEFRTEFYNMPNVINFGNPNTTLTSPLFGQITGAGSARQIQFALRYAF